MASERYYYSGLLEVKKKGRLEDASVGIGFDCTG
jgi:hypothetical protein